MKNNIVIRLENTLFNTNNINKHLPKAKDKANYVKTSLQKCKFNDGFGDIIVFLKHMCSIKHIKINLVTSFKREYVYKLLEINDLHFVDLCSTIESAIGNDKSTIVISASENDLQYAMQNNVDCIKYPANTNDIFAAIGVRKATKPLEIAA